MFFKQFLKSIFMWPWLKEQSLQSLVGKGKTSTETHDHFPPHNTSTNIVRFIHESFKLNETLLCV